MITEQEIPNVVKNGKERFARKSRERNLDAELYDKDYRLENDWLYLSVSPMRKGELTEYAEMLTEIEKELRKEGIDNVLLVPTLPDDY